MAVSVRSGAFRTYEHMPPCAALSGHYTEHHGWRDKAKYSPNPEHRWRPLAIGYPLVPLLHHMGRSEEHTSELQSLLRISYAVFCLKKKKQTPDPPTLLHT